MSKKNYEENLLNDLIEDLKKVTTAKVSYYQESNLYTLKFDEHAIVVVKGIYEFNNTLLAIKNSIQYVEAVKWHDYIQRYKQRFKAIVHF